MLCDVHVEVREQLSGTSFLLPLRVLVIQTWSHSKHFYLLSHCAELTIIFGVGGGELLNFLHRFMCMCICLSVDM